MRRLVCIVLAIALAGVATGGCGSEPEEARSPLALVPQDAAISAELIVRPEGAQRQAIEELAAHFPGGERLGEELISSLDESIAEETDVPGVEFTYEDDIEPWLGQRAAIFYLDFPSDPQGAYLLEATDEDAADEALRKAAETDRQREREKEYDGLEYLVDEDGTAGGVLDGFLVLGSEEGFQAVVDVSKGSRESVAATAEDPIATPGEDGVLAVARVDLNAIVKAVLTAPGQQAPTALPPGSGAQRALAAQPIADDAGEPAAGLGVLELALFVESDRVRLDATAPMEGPGGTGGRQGDAAEGAAADILAGLPADAFAGAALPRLGRTFARGFRQGIKAQLGPVSDPRFFLQRLRQQIGFDPIDLFGALGDAGLFARSDEEQGLGGAAVIRVRDRLEVRKALAGIRFVLERQPGIAVAELPPSLREAKGFSFAAPGVEQPVYLVLRRDRFAVALGGDAAAAAVGRGPSLESSPVLTETQDALGPNFEPGLFVDFPPLLRALERSPTGDEPGFAEVARYLAALHLAVVGAGSEGEDTLLRAVVTVD